MTPSPQDDPKTLVSTDWLAAHLRDPDLRVLDASWFLPGSGRDAKAEYDAAHIPGARYFDIDEISDHRSDLPHMAPPVEKFMSRMRAMGVRRLPVVNLGGNLSGMLTMDDLLKFIADEMSDLVRLIRREQKREKDTRPPA
jgi:3-mercaptopyruvate sulfurtransferase SseA